MAIDTVHKKRAGLTAGMPFYASSTSLGSPISASDRWEAAWTYPIGQYDLSLGVSDSLSLADAKIFTDALAKLDVLSYSDATALVTDFIRSYLDTLGITDSAVLTLLIPVILSDSFALIESLAMELGKALTDSLVISDNIVLVIPSWLRKLRVEDVEHFITITRIR